MKNVSICVVCSSELRYSSMVNAKNATAIPSRCAGMFTLSPALTNASYWSITDITVKPESPITSRSIPMANENSGDSY